METLKNKRKFLVNMAIVALILGLLALAPWRVVYNKSPSMPFGWYVVRKGPPKKGQMVLMHPPDVAIQLGCANKRDTLLKIVVAHAGDEVCLKAGQLHINGKPYSQTEPKLQKKLGFSGCLRIEDGHWFVATDRPNSCDSRFFGPQPTTQFWGVAHPLEK